MVHPMQCLRFALALPLVDLPPMSASASGILLAAYLWRTIKDVFLDALTFIQDSAPLDPAHPLSF